MKQKPLEEKYLKMTTFSRRVINYNQSLNLRINLPRGIRIMNPFKENPSALAVSSTFYQKYYNDNQSRRLILGINPGRFGAGITGIPFTDTKRLREKCGLQIEKLESYEPSSVFVYKVIDAYGGVEKFYSDFYINSIVPLGFVKMNDKGREVNYNYYDQKELQERITPFAIQSIKDHIAIGCKTDKVFCLGTGKNVAFLNKLNNQFHFFETVIPLEHPRYVMQYKMKQLDEYVEKFISLLTS